MCVARGHGLIAGMSNLPVDAAELAGFEQRLGVRLPEHYVSSLLDPGIGAVLRDRRIGDALGEEHRPSQDRVQRRPQLV